VLSDGAIRQLWFPFGMAVYRIESGSRASFCSWPGNGAAMRAQHA